MMADIPIRKGKDAYLCFCCLVVVGFLLWFGFFFKRASGSQARIKKVSASAGCNGGVTSPTQSHHTA